MRYSRPTCRSRTPSFGTRGSQVQILPLRPALSRFPGRAPDRNVPFGETWGAATTSHGGCMSPAFTGTASSTTSQKAKTRTFFRCIVLNSRKRRFAVTSPDWNAQGYVERRKENGSYMSVKNGRLEELVKYVSPRGALRHLYRITIGPKVYSAQDIEDLESRPDFPKK
jgi:hypothetical protein